MSRFPAPPGFAPVDSAPAAPAGQKFPAPDGFSPVADAPKFAAPAGFTPVAAPAPVISSVNTQMAAALGRPAGVNINTPVVNAPVVPSAPGPSTWQDIKTQAGQIPTQVQSAFSKAGAGIMDFLDEARERKNEDSQASESDLSPVVHEAYDPSQNPDTEALREYARGKESTLQPAQTLTGKAVQTVGSIGSQMAPVLVAGAVGGPEAAAVAGGAMMGGQGYTEAYERRVEQRIPPVEAAKTARLVGVGEGAVGVVTGGIVGGAGKEVAKGVIRKAAESAVEGMAYGGIQSGASQAITSAATGDKPDYWQVPEGAGTGAAINVGLSLLGAAMTKGKAHLLPRFQQRMRRAKTPAEAQAIVDEARSITDLGGPAEGRKFPAPEGFAPINEPNVFGGETPKGPLSGLTAGEGRKFPAPSGFEPVEPAGSTEPGRTPQPQTPAQAGPAQATSPPAPPAISPFSPQQSDAITGSDVVQQPSDRGNAPEAYQEAGQPAPVAGEVSGGEGGQQSQSVDAGAPSQPAAAAVNADVQSPQVSPSAWLETSQRLNDLGWSRHSLHNENGSAYGDIKARSPKDAARLVDELTKLPFTDGGMVVGNRARIALRPAPAVGADVQPAPGDAAGAPSNAAAAAASAEPAQVEPSKAQRYARASEVAAAGWQTRRRQLQGQIESGKTVPIPDLEPFRNEPWADQHAASRKSARPASPDALGTRRAELQDQLRDVVVREFGADVANLSPASPHYVQAHKGETRPGVLVSLEKATQLAEDAPEGHPAKLVLHNLRELEKNPRGTKVQAVSTNDVPDGGRVQVNDRETFTVNHSTGLVEDGITGEIPEGGVTLYGKKVLPPVEEAVPEGEPFAGVREEPAAQGANSGQTVRTETLPPVIADGIKTAGGGADIFGNPAFEAKAGAQEMFGFKQVDDSVKRERAKTYSDEIERKEFEGVARPEADQKLADKFDEAGTPEMFGEQPPRPPEPPTEGPPKSKGHIRFVAGREYYQAPDGTIMVARKSSPIGEDGYRTDRAKAPENVARGLKKRIEAGKEKVEGEKASGKLPALQGESGAGRTPPQEQAPQRPRGKAPWQLTRQQFRDRYYQHNVLRPDAPDVTEGFKSGIGPNVVSVTDGPPTDIMQQRYGTKKGRPIYIVPPEWVRDTPNGPKIKDGWVPSPDDKFIPDRDHQPVHEMVVKRAVDRGETVPPEVLKEYPNLAKSFDRPAPSDGGTAPKGGGSSGGGKEASTEPSALPITAGSQPKTATLTPKIQTLRPVNVPELIGIARDILGDKMPAVRARMKALGYFKHMPGVVESGRIEVRADLAEQSQSLAGTLAHEIGHAVDFLPDATLKRGNILGRIATLHGYLKHTLTTAVPAAKLAEIRKELIDVSEWWRGPIAGTDSQQAYRKSSKELYADAISVLLNSPGDVQQRAPKFFEAFFQHIDAKPDVKDAYFTTMDLLNGTPEDLAANRRQDIREMFTKGEDIFRARLAEQKSGKQSPINYLRQLLFDKSIPVLTAEHKANPKALPWDESLAAKHALEEFNMQGNALHLFGKAMSEEVFEKLDPTTDRSTVGEYQFLRRIGEGDRGGAAEAAQKEIMDLTGKPTWPEAKEDYLQNLAAQALKAEEDDLYIAAMSGKINPLGHTPETARQQLADLEKQIGPDRWKNLTETVQKYQDLQWEQVERAAESGVYSKETVNELRKNKDFYSPFAVLKYLDTKVKAGIFKQIGTFEEIANPLDSGLLKGVSLIRAIEANNAKRAVADFYDKTFPGEFGPEITIDKYHRLKPPRTGKEHLIYMVDGKPRAREVDPYIARVFASHDIGALTRVSRWMNSSYRIFHPLWIGYNVGWQARNLVRDPARTWKNLASLRVAEGQNFGQQMLGAILDVPKLGAAYARAVPHAIRRAWGWDDPLINQMIKERAIRQSFSKDPLAEDAAQFETFLKQTGIWEKPANRNRVIRTIQAIADNVERVGEFTETLSKVAAFDQASRRGNLTTRERAYIVRNYAGTPNTARKGMATELSNAVWTYSNVILQGYRADAELAFHPKTAGGYWLRATMQNFLPKAAMIAAATGLFGTAYQQLMGDIPDYDKQKYIIVPLGRDGDGKPVYLRLPHDDTTRVLSAAMWNLAQKKSVEGIGDAVGLVAGEFPAVNPLVQMASKWAQYLSGQNPRDDFRGRDIIGPDEQKVGGWPRLKQMLLWQTDQAGELGRYIRVAAEWKKNATTSEPTTTTEKIINSVPGLSGLVKVSDRGKTEAAWKAVADEDRSAAELRLNMPDNARALSKERYRLNRLHANNQLPREDARRRNVINGWYANVYKSFHDRIERAEEKGDKKAADSLRKELDRVTAQRVESMRAAASPLQPASR